VEREVKITYSSKEIYSLYAIEKPRLSQNSQAPNSKPKPRHELGSPKALYMSYEDVFITKGVTLRLPS